MNIIQIQMLFMKCILIIKSTKAVGYFSPWICAKYASGNWFWDCGPNEDVLVASTFANWANGDSPTLDVDGSKLTAVLDDEQNYFYEATPREVLLTFVVCEMEALFCPSTWGKLIVGSMSCYQLRIMKNAVNYVGAKKVCVTNNTWLVTLETEEEWIALRNVLQQNKAALVAAGIGPTPAPSTSSTTTTAPLTTTTTTPPPTTTTTTDPPTATTTTPPPTTTTATAPPTTTTTNAPPTATTTTPPPTTTTTTPPPTTTVATAPPTTTATTAPPTTTTTTPPPTTTTTTPPPTTTTTTTPPITTTTTAPPTTTTTTPPPTTTTTTAPPTSTTPVPGVEELPLDKDPNPTTTISLTPDNDIADVVIQSAWLCTKFEASGWMWHCGPYANTTIETTFSMWSTGEKTYGDASKALGLDETTYKYFRMFHQDQLLQFAVCERDSRHCRNSWFRLGYSTEACYQLHSSAQGLSYEDAYSLCMSHKSWLLTIETDEERKDIVNLLQRQFYTTPADPVTTTQLITNTETSTAGRTTVQEELLSATKSESTTITPGTPQFDDVTPQFDDVTTQFDDVTTQFDEVTTQFDETRTQFDAITIVTAINITKLSIGSSRLPLSDSATESQLSTEMAEKFNRNTLKESTEKDWETSTKKSTGTTFPSQTVNIFTEVNNNVATGNDLYTSSTEVSTAQDSHTDHTFSEHISTGQDVGGDSGTPVNHILTEIVTNKDSTIVSGGYLSTFATEGMVRRSAQPRDLLKIKLVKPHGLDSDDRDPDKRPFAIAVGSFAILFVVAFVICIFLLDISTYCRDLKRMKRNVQSFFRYHQNGIKIGP